MTRLLQKETPLGLHQPELSAIQMAMFRSLFAGIIMIPLVRRREMTFRPLMPLMVACFAAMNATYLTALAGGQAANAILLQNTAPFWVFLIAVCVLKEKIDRRSVVSLVIGLTGIAIILTGLMLQEMPPPSGGPQSNLLGISVLAISSGFFYASVIVCLRALRSESSPWLTFLNHFGSGIILSISLLIILGPTDWWTWLTTPTWKQLLFLAFFGGIQMALPYWLFSKGLRTIGPQEAGIITLLEPMLNPVWAYLISPDTEKPPATTWVGGIILLTALAYRYWPNKRSADSLTEAE